MEPPDRQQCHIFVVASVKEDYKTAELLLHERYYELSLKPSGATCLVGKIGSHHIVLAGNGEDMLDIASFTNDTVNDILKQFPSIKAGFLIGIGGIAPATGIARAGDVVIGTPQGIEPGLVQFDALETTRLNRLSATHQMVRPPAAVLSIVEDSRSSFGRLKCQEELFNKAMTVYSADTEQENLNWCNSIKFLHGKVASSGTTLTENKVLNKTGHDSKVLCFERAAARLKPQLPILTVCGIENTTKPFDNALKKKRSGTAAVIYTLLIATKVDPNQLSKQHAFNDLFSYDSFRLERPSFRLIQLKREPYHLLQCSMFQAYLDEKDSIVPCEALSYAWGSQSTPFEIMVNGKVMSITASLYDGLCHLEQASEDRILWVDALCIDQSNIKERSHQVNHMGEIYRKSENVIVWLGDISGDAVVLKTVIDEFKKQLPAEALQKWSRGDQWREAEKTLAMSDDARLLNGLKVFMGNTWFTRVWVLQEVANARRAVVKCSLGEIPAKLFAMLPQIIGSPVSEQCQAVLDIMPGPSNTTSWWVQDRNLCTLLCKFKGSEASDPRDRVYALLGIASDNNSSGIKADYAKEERMIVQDLCIYIYGERSPPGILSMTSIHDLQSQLPTISAQLLANRLEHKTTTKSLLLFLTRQGIVKNVSAYSFHKLLDHGSLLTNAYLNKCEVSICANSDVAERFLSRFPDVFVSFVQEHGIPPVTIQKSVSWMVRNSYDGLQAFLEDVALEIDPGSELMVCLMKHGPKDLTPLLKLVFKAFREPFHMNETVFIRAIGRGKTTLNLLLQNCRHPIMITQMVLANAVLADIETLRIILETPRNAIHIEHLAFSKAAERGSATLQFLLDHCGGSVLISEPLLSIAVRFGTGILEKTLEMSSPVSLKSLKIDDSLFAEAAMRGPKTLRILLDNFQHATHTIPRSIYSAAGHDPSTMRTLLEMSPYKIELDESLFVRAVSEGPEKLQLLFQYCIRPINLTDNMLEHAIEAGISILEVIFDNWAFDIETTELITQQAAMAGIQTLEYLIANSRSKIQITNNILQKSRAVDSSYHKLAELRHSETDVTEHEAIAAIESGVAGFLELLNRPGINFKLTKTICWVANKHDYAFQLLRRKRPSELFMFRQQVFIHGSPALADEANPIAEQRKLENWER